MKPLLLSLLLGCTVAFAVACSDDEPDDDAVSATPPRQPPQGQLVEARVIGVVDGATIEVDISGQLFQVRYLGVEIVQPAQADGTSLSQEALAFNRFLVEGRTVEIERGSTETDGSGNLLRYVYVDGEMFNETLLTNGYATVSGFPEDFEYKMEFLVAEEKARASARGIWASESVEEQISATPTPVQQFGGGTLPLPPQGLGGGVCDFSGTSDPVIKGNVDSLTGERAYHVPGGLFYATTVVDEAQGDRWFCTEGEAETAGWHRSKR